MTLATQLASAIREATGNAFEARGQQPVGGGCIHQALRLDGDAGRYFVKLNRPDCQDLFEAEADGLAALAACGALRVPRVVACGRIEGYAFLALEWLDLSGTGDPALLGRGLAALHRCLGPRHGWHRDNYIGETPQHNGPDEHWPRFYAQRRLQPQLAGARERGAWRLYEGGMKLCARIDAFFPGCRPAPSLLHGDLWGGNAGGLPGGEPVVFDPAAHYGDRETDLAMTELFGGFDASFRAAYEEAWPLDPGYPRRRRLYQLYHVLNHDRLFGGAYRAQAERMVGALVAEISA